MKVTFREAKRTDLEAVVALLSDDVLGKAREIEDLEPYESAFDIMAGESGNILLIGEAEERVVATYQLTVISGLSLGASRRAQIEGVRVTSDMRGQGIGAALLSDAEARARDAGATLLQFTSNATRDRAHAFYLRCGYVATHIGFKKPLQS